MCTCRGKHVLVEANQKEGRLEEEINCLLFVASECLSRQASACCKSQKVCILYIYWLVATRVSLS